LAGNLRQADVREAPEVVDRARVDDARPEELGMHHRPGRGGVFRLRDLDRRGRWVAVGFAAALLISPLLAFVWAVPDWAPAGDTAIMGLRALDVGTSRTPLIGQPSSSELYVPSDGPAHHPGPTHFYLLAGPVRLLGGGIGMPLVSVLIVGSCVLVAAWAVFRQLGPRAGIVAAVVLGAVMFTTGASSLIDPVSSRVAGYPLLCSSVLLWCVLCGDLRLLPLTTAVVSFTAQQHLSVEPSIVVLTAGAVAGLMVWLVRHHRWRDPPVRRQFARASGWSALVALVMWAPVLLDQVSDTGNLGRVASYATTNDRDTLGATSAVRQIAHALGLPPLLGQPEFSGQWLLDSPSIFTWLTAAAVTAAVAALGARWWRASRRKTGLAIMVGLAALAGLANGSSIPVGFEQARPVFYHWSFVLAFFTALVLGLGALDLARRTTTTTRASFAPALACLALLAILIPSALNPTLDRTTNTLDGTQAFWKGRQFDQLTDTILARRHDLGTQTLLLGGASRALAFDLADRGLDVRVPRSMGEFVHEDRLVDKSTVHSGLVLQGIGRKGPGRAPPGELLAEINLKGHSGVDAANTLGIIGLFRPGQIVGLRLYLLNREELLEFARPSDL
jgi:hypothetical protein